METETDSDLLQSFIRDGNGRAFEELVGRHAPMVRGVALRCTGDPAEANEITQAVFTLLARKAPSLKNCHLSGWMHNAAFLEARNAVRKSDRYRKALRELNTQVNLMPSPPASDSEESSWEEIRPFLDEAISQLPEKARHPVILRYFERKSIREISAATGKSEEASRKELQRSLHQLGSWLKKRGIVTTSAALSAMLAGQSLLAPPASASVIAATALETASSLRDASFLPSALNAGQSLPFLKLVAAAVVMAAIPAVLLWRENSRLRAELDRLGALAAAAPGISQTETAKPAGRGRPAGGVESGEGDFETRLRRLLQEEAGPGRTWSLHQLFEDWTKTLPEEAFKNASRIADHWLRRDIRGRMVGWWAESDPSAAWDYVKRNPTGDLSPDSLQKVLEGSGRGRIGETLKFFETHREEELGRLVMMAGFVFAELYDRGHSATLIPWVESLPEGKLKDAAVSRITGKWALYEPEKAKTWLETNIKNESLQNGRQALAEAWIAADPPAALQWIGALPDDSGKSALFTSALGRWIEIDSNAAGGWLAAQAPSQALDGSFAKYAFKVMGDNPADTMPWAESIADETMRRRTMEWVAMVWSKRDPQGLRDYIAKGSFSDEEKSRLLNPAPQEGPFPGWPGFSPRGGPPGRH